MKITINHTKACELCTRGVFKWLLSHGFSKDEFLTKGIDDSKLLATGDSRATMVSKYAHSIGENDG